MSLVEDELKYRRRSRGGAPQQIARHHLVTSLIFLWDRVVPAQYATTTVDGWFHFHRFILEVNAHLPPEVAAYKVFWPAKCNAGGPGSATAQAFLRFLTPQRATKNQKKK